jgi:hypothetical protein
MEKEQMKASRHKRIISRKKLSREDVEKGKDFNALLGNYKNVTSPLNRNPRLLRAIVLILVIAMLVALVIIEESK